jgi:hypothetical protein
MPEGYVTSPSTGEKFAHVPTKLIFLGVTIVPCQTKSQCQLMVNDSAFQNQKQSESNFTKRRTWTKFPMLSKSPEKAAPRLVVI